MELCEISVARATALDVPLCDPSTAPTFLCEFLPYCGISHAAASLDRRYASSRDLPYQDIYNDQILRTWESKCELIPSGINRVRGSKQEYSKE